MPETTSTPEFISRQIDETRYYFPDLTPAHPEDLGVVCGGYEICRPGYHKSE